MIRAAGGRPNDFKRSSHTDLLEHVDDALAAAVGPLRFARMSGSSIAARDAAPWVLLSPRPPRIVPFQRLRPCEVCCSGRGRRARFRGLVVTVGNVHTGDATAYGIVRAHGRGGPGTAAPRAKQ